MAENQANPTGQQPPASQPAPCCSGDPAGKPGPDVIGNFTRLPLVEKILGVIGVIAILAWIIVWSGKVMEYGPSGWEVYGLFKGSWFSTLSFFGALAVVAVVVLKVLAVQCCPPAIEGKIIAIASLVPVLGFLIDEFRKSFSMFLALAASVALAYISATTYWRQRIPDFVTKPLGDNATKN